MRLMEVVFVVVIVVVLVVITLLNVRNSGLSNTTSGLPCSAALATQLEVRKLGTRDSNRRVGAPMLGVQLLALASTIKHLGWRSSSRDRLSAKPNNKNKIQITRLTFAPHLILV